MDLYSTNHSNGRSAHTVIKYITFNAQWLSCLGFVLNPVHRTFKMKRKIRKWQVYLLCLEFYHCISAFSVYMVYVQLDGSSYRLFGFCMQWITSRYFTVAVTECTFFIWFRALHERLRPYSNTDPFHGSDGCIECNFKEISFWLLVLIIVFVVVVTATAFDTGKSR